MYLKFLREILAQEPDYNPKNGAESEAVEKLISMGYVNPIKCETRDGFIALLVTAAGKRCLSKLDR